MRETLLERRLIVDNRLPRDLADTGLMPDDLSPDRVQRMEEYGG